MLVVRQTVCDDGKYIDRALVVRWTVALSECHASLVECCVAYKRLLSTVTLVS